MAVGCCPGAVGQAGDEAEARQTAAGPAAAVEEGAPPTLTRKRTTRMAAKVEKKANNAGG